MSSSHWKVCSKTLVLCGLLALTPILIVAQSQPASDPQALSYASRAMAALTGGNSISDITLTGNVTYSAGVDDYGSATLMAIGTSESRTDLSLSSGTRTEIRDAQTGTSLGKWISQNGASGMFARHNCLTDAVWFFPALTSLNIGGNIVMSNVGPEMFHGQKVQHIRSYVYQPGPEGDKKWKSLRHSSSTP